MKVLILGATGGTGAKLLAQAVAAGHVVTVISRHPEQVRSVADPSVSVVDGDVLKPGPWQDVAQGHETVLSCLGSIDRKHPTTVYSHGTINVLDAMGQSPARRLICLSSAGLFVPPDTPFAQKLVTRVVINRMYRHGYDDMRRMEAALQDIDVRWTVIRPPMLSDKPPTGAYRSSVNAHLPRPTSIPRDDLAHYMLHAIDDQATWQTVVEIST